MSAQNIDEPGASRSTDVAQAFDAMRGALFSEEIKRLVEILAEGANRGSSLEEAEQRWRNLQKRSLEARVEAICKVSLPWWSLIRTPFWTCCFLHQRRRMRTKSDVDLQCVERFDASLARAEFAFALSAASRNYLRQKIDAGAITRWRAQSIVRSPGCMLSKQGDVLPNPIGLQGNLFGVGIAAALICVVALFATAVGLEMLKPCPSGCVVLGATQMVLSAGYLACVAHSLSIGRRHSAQRLKQLLSDF